MDLGQKRIIARSLFQVIFITILEDYLSYQTYVPGMEGLDIIIIDLKVRALFINTNILIYGLGETLIFHIKSELHWMRVLCFN